LFEAFYFISSIVVDALGCIVSCFLAREFFQGSLFFVPVKVRHDKLYPNDVKIVSKLLECTLTMPSLLEENPKFFAEKCETAVEEWILNETDIEPYRREKIAIGATSSGEDEFLESYSREHNAHYDKNWPPDQRNYVHSLQERKRRIKEARVRCCFP
jgi:hypothetical protein